MMAYRLCRLWDRRCGRDASRIHLVGPGEEGWSEDDDRDKEDTLDGEDEGWMRLAMVSIDDESGGEYAFNDDVPRNADESGE